MAKKYRCLAFGATNPLKWPDQCAVCGEKPNSSLTARYAATSNLRWLGSGAAWTSIPVRIQYPVCSRHKLIFLIPALLAGESFLFLFVRVLAACAFGIAVLGIAFLLVAGAWHLISGDVTSLGTSGKTFGENSLYLLLYLIPHSAIFLSRHYAPVRVDYFKPPVLDVIIRNDEVANQVAAINQVAESN